MIDNINKFQVKCPLPVMVVGGFFLDTTEHAWPGSVKMRKRIEYQKGEKIGACIFLYDTQDNPRKAMFKCKCGNEFETTIAKLKNGNTTSCGCYKKRKFSEAHTHGMTKHPAFSIWSRIFTRCYNERSTGYHKYGGRGIKLCDEWLNNPKVFIDYIMSLENAMQPSLTIDRIRNNEGYKPGNLRWATKHIQAVNRRKRNKSTSKYIGVSFDKRTEKWDSTITIDYIQYHLGQYFTEEEAAIIRDEYILANNLTEYKLNLER